MIKVISTSVLFALTAAVNLKSLQQKQAFQLAASVNVPVSVKVGKADVEQRIHTKLNPVPVPVPSPKPVPQVTPTPVIVPTPAPEPVVIPP